jgi:hypothetical protein
MKTEGLFIPRTDLLETSDFLPSNSELFSVDSMPGGQSGEIGHVVVCGEETGGSDALMPVLRELRSRNIGVTALLAGNGLRILTTRGHEHDLRVHPIDTWPKRATQPNAVLITPSEDGRLEEYLLQKHPDTNSVVIEDYHESSRRSVAHVHELGIQPPTVCVLDPEAERLIALRFPDVDVPVVVTGSPTFDELFDEDLASKRAEMRSELGILDSQKFVTLFMPRLGEELVGYAQEIAKSLQVTDDSILFTSRQHPSDTLSKEAFKQIFNGSNMIDTSDIPLDKVAVAADLAIAQRSVTNLRAVTRQQLTITLNQFIAPGFTFPLVDSGASLPATPSELPSVISELLAGESERCDELRKNMKQYQTDGKAASRVADIVCRSIVSKP